MTSDPDLRPAIRGLLLRRLKKEARAFQMLKGGRNSRVYRVDCRDGSAVAVKAYFHSTRDPRDRMGCEVRALRFLRRAGLGQTPQLLAGDRARRVAVYEFVAGRHLRTGDIGAAEIEDAVAFLRALKTIADSGKGRSLPAASEACFSIEAILRNLDDRFRRLGGAAARHPVLADFLRGEIAPCRRLAVRRCLGLCREHGIAPAAPIPWSERTLSPSDFGFHNALRRADGRLVFLDFEYFGWDDPAKMAADFVLHPAMRLPPALKQRFVSRLLAGWPGAPRLLLRLRAVYPLFALKWCAILLNEFALDDLARRRFAHDSANESRRKTAQLEKARRMLTQVTHDHYDFHGLL
jgi:hypothetical protein